MDRVPFIADHPPMARAATLFVVMAAVGFGLVPWFGKAMLAAGMPAFAIAFYRFALTALILLPVLKVPRHQRGTLAWGIAAGIVMGFGWIGYVRAIETVPVATVGVFYMSYPVFTLLIGWLWFREIPSLRAMAAGLTILAAAAIAMSPQAVTPDLYPMLLMSLTAPVGFAFGIQVLTRKLVALHPLARNAGVAFGAAIGLVPLLFTAEPSSVLPQAASDWWLIAGIAVVTALLPQLIYTIYAPVIGASKAAMAGSVELPTMFVIAWLAFGDAITPTQWIACVLVLLAIFLTESRATRNVATNLAVPPSPQQEKEPEQTPRP